MLWKQQSLLIDLGSKPKHVFFGGLLVFIGILSIGGLNNFELVTDVFMIQIDLAIAILYVLQMLRGQGIEVSLMIGF